MFNTQIRNPWTNVYGLARSGLALSTLITLTLTDLEVLFRPLGAGPDAVAGGLPWPAQLGLFHLLSDHLSWARWIASAVLVAVIIGWRPRLTGVLHWWITFSYQANAVLVEGGDQVATIMCLLLIPVTLGDRRTWHWQAPDVIASAGRRMTALISDSALIMLRFQVAVIYFFACVEKFKVPEWLNGTALYYWSLHPQFGLADWIEPVLGPLLTGKVAVMALTWGAMILEAILFAGLFMKRSYRPWLLYVGILFHAGIAVVHGLFSFSLIMMCALVLYLWPYDVPLQLPQRLAVRVKTWISNLISVSSPARVNAETGL